MRIRPTVFRVRQALKDYLLYASAQQVYGIGGKVIRVSAAETVRRALDEMLQTSWSPADAREGVAEERDALDRTHRYRPEPLSSYRYRDTPWVPLSVKLDTERLDALRREATRLGVKRDELLRAALFNTLQPRFDLPPNQWPSEAEVGYVHAFDEDSNPIDPRHPQNYGREREAVARLRRLANVPDADPRHVEILGKFIDFVENVIGDYHRFVVDDCDSVEKLRETIKDGMIRWSHRSQK